MKALLKFRGDYLEVEEYFPTEEDYNNPNYNFGRGIRYFRTEDDEIYGEGDLDFDYVPECKQYEFTGTLTRNTHGTLFFMRDNDNTLYQIPKDLYPNLKPNESINIEITIRKK